MRVIIAGGSGFLGQAMQAAFRRGGHDVRVLTRRAHVGGDGDIPWQPDGTAGPWAEALSGADAVVNLAGENVAGGRWSDARKRTLVQSRLAPTRSLAAAIRHVSQPPATLLNASGIGYYGPCEDSTAPAGGREVTEETSAGRDFLARLCVDWENEASGVSEVTRVVHLRSGVVLHPSGGALAKMLPLFRLGLGGRLGDGQQYFPWIHLDDWVGFVMWLLQHPAAHGPFNITAPQPVTNAELTQTLARTLNRPAVIPVPAFALRLALGELAGTLLTGQRAIPARAQEMGFKFRFGELGDALTNLLKAGAVGL